MGFSTWKINFTVLIFIAAISSNGVFAEYIEGIDTTNANGYGLDSAFRLIPQTQSGLEYIGLSGQKLACYFAHPIVTSLGGAFRYAFNDINEAADSLSFAPVLDRISIGLCFVVQKSKDSTFSKIMLINKIEDYRYIYKYGTNTAFKNRMLIKSDYNRSVRYKPNNLYYRNNQVFTWEPPLPNNNHLIGYILYIQKKGVAIDTTAAINLAQWDSVGFTDSTSMQLPFSYDPHGEYYNLIAVYDEGKSDFLNGWSQLRLLSSTTNVFNPIYSQELFTIKYLYDFIYISINKLQLPYIINIYSLDGKLIDHFSDFSHNRIILNKSENKFSLGYYLLRAEFPDRSVITQPFTVTR
jgi:hypothetical protein